MGGTKPLETAPTAEGGPTTVPPPRSNHLAYLAQRRLPPQPGMSRRDEAQAGPDSGPPPCSFPLPLSSHPHPYTPPTLWRPFSPGIAPPSPPDGDGRSSRCPPPCPPPVGPPILTWRCSSFPHRRGGRRRQAQAVARCRVPALADELRVGGHPIQVDLWHRYAERGEGIMTYEGRRDGRGGGGSHLV